MSDAEDLKQVAKLFTGENFVEAEKLCAAVVARSPANGRACYLHGVSSYKNNNPTMAAQLFQKAVALNANDFDSLFNLGVVCWELRRHDEALAAYQSLLERAPHYTKALPNLGQALMSAGRFEEGRAAFDRALQAKPDDAQSAALWLEYACLYLPMKDRIAVCDQALTKPVPHTTRHTALLYRGTAEWVLQDDAALEKSLAAAMAVPAQSDQGFANMVIYKTFLTRLLAYRKANPALYAGEGKPLFLVGDSHSLSYAGVRLKMDGEQYKIDSRLIIGAKAWHIASGPNPRRGALAHYFASLPAGSTVLCAFGEIDCRKDGGILPYWQKTGGDLGAIVAGQVKNYVAAVSDMASSRALKPVFLAVPAPHPASGPRQQVVALFNAQLEKSVDEAGHRHADLYKITAGSDGFSTAAPYIDNYHLKPEEILKVLDG